MQLYSAQARITSTTSVAVSKKADHTAYNVRYKAAELNRRQEL